MTTEQLTRLRNLPEPSQAMMDYCRAVAAFFEEDAPGPYRAPAGRINAKDAMDEAWRALPYQDRERVRAIEATQ